MRRMIDMIRSSAVSASLVQAASRGALLVPPAEMIEILVYLANHNKVFGQHARMTLAGWEEASSLAAASDPQTSQEVLDYFIAPENLRPRLLPALLENPGISEATLATMAGTGSREVVEAMLSSPRVQKLPAIFDALASNPNAPQTEPAPRGELRASTEIGATGLDESPVDVVTESVEAGTPPDDEAVQAYLTEHAKELGLEGEKPFQPLGGIDEFKPATGEDSVARLDEPPSAPTAAGVSTPPPLQAAAGAAAQRSPFVKKTHLSHEEERGSALQKISRLDVKGRIQLAMKGNKEERSILIRDGTKLVALAVLESGKITDGEVEKFASQKNVLEAVLRQIPMKRRFVKNYNVMRNLVANPRTPLDVSLALVKNLLISDLRNLSSNKEVSETIRRLALKMFKQKTDPTKKSQ
jgi:hypothetical protein